MFIASGECAAEGCESYSTRLSAVSFWGLFFFTSVGYNVSLNSCLIKDLHLALQLLTLLLPAAALLVGAGVALLSVAQLSGTQQEMLGLLPYLLVIVAGTLGVGFKRGRVLLAALNLGGAYLLIQTSLQTSLARPDNYVLFSLLSLLLPLNFALIAWYKERGVLTWVGCARVVGVLLGYAVLFALKQSGELAYWLPSLPTSMIEMAFAQTFLSDAAAWAFGVSLLPVLLSLGLRKTHADAGILAAWGAALVMLVWFDQAMISSLFVSAALLALSVSVVQNSYNMAFIDELTGIPARRALRDKLATLGKQYTIAMMDIDHFKKFNDTYGHDVGDQVLRMVAAKINQVRGGGKAYRFGGEEFTVVFAGKEEHEAEPFLEEVRQTIANYPMRIRGDQRPKDNETGKQRRNESSESEIVTVTISIGAAHKQDIHANPDAVIKSADQALYQAKGAGRNQTVISTQPKVAEPKPRKSAARRSKRDYARR